MNDQPVEKRDNYPGNVLDVVGVFFTIQGEGPYSGHPAIFIRLAGCNLKCPGCDTDYTTGRKLLEIHEINKLIGIELAKYVQYLSESNQPIIVITGGEPFRQNINPLVNFLADLGFLVQIETNGTLPPPKDLNHSVKIVCSPKTSKINSKMAKRANCFKYVLSADSICSEDGLPICVLNNKAYPQVARPPEGKPIYLQPMDSGDPLMNQRNIDAVKTSCIRFNYILQLQIHKIIGVQ